MFSSHRLAAFLAAFSCVFLLFPPKAMAQDAFLVADLAPGLENGDAFPFVDGEPVVDFAPVAFDGDYYFAANHPRFGVELWRSDGTPDGTELVADLCLGPCDSRPDGFIVFGGRLYFAADDGVVGRELRMMIPGRKPVLFADFCPGPCDSFPADLPAALTSLGNRLIFAADQGAGAGLYTSDGRLTDTQRFADLCAGPHDCDAWPRSFLNNGTLAYFVAGAEPGPVWRTDGSAAGTLELLTNGRAPRLLGDRLLALSREPGGMGQELWASDGSLDGTAAIADLCPGSCFGAGAILGELDDLLYFSGRESGNAQLALYRTDGTARGTQRVLDREIFSDLAAVADGELFFFVGQAVSGQPALWATDGSEPGTRRVVAETIFPESVASAGGLFFFHGEQQLWSSNGTAAGTVRLQSWPEPIASARELDGQLFFTAHTAAFGRELWTSDGTRLGTRLFADLHRGAASSRPSDLTALGQQVIFDTENGGLFLSDGSFAGTAALGFGPRSAAGFHPFQDVVLFCPESRFDSPGLWQTDGTVAGTFRWAEELFDCGAFSTAGGELLFGANSRLGLPGVELWATDGTVDGTRLVRNIDPPTGSLLEPDGDSRPRDFVVVGDRVIFAADRRVEGSELWQTDGTRDGTRFLRDLCPGGCSSDPEGLLPIGGVAVFAATDRTGDRLWATDGTPSGTRRVRNLAMSGQPTFAGEVVRAGDRLFFTAYNRRSGAELWTSDGSGSGTFLVREIAAARRSADPAALTAVGERVVFTATDALSGRELWTSDGTAEGTRLVQDLEPGPGSSAPGDFVAAGDFVYFQATTTAGTELWAVPRAALETPAGN